MPNPHEVCPRPEEQRYDVNASVIAMSGASDGAYDLILRGASIDEFLAQLRETLSSDWGLTNESGVVYLRLNVVRAGDGDNVPL